MRRNAMRRLISLFAGVAALAAFAAPMARAEQAATPAQTFAFFAGCWRGDFANRPGVTDERCFTSLLDGWAMRDAHVVRGGPTPYAGETTYSYDPSAQRVVYTYVASDGGGSSGYVTRDGDALVFPADRY